MARTARLWIPLLLLLGACARVSAPDPADLDCAGLDREIARAEAEQNDPLIEKIVEMPVDLVTAVAMPWRLGHGLLPDEDPIRLSDLRQTRETRGCRDAAQPAPATGHHQGTRP